MLLFIGTVDDNMYIEFRVLCAKLTFSGVSLCSDNDKGVGKYVTNLMEDFYSTEKNVLYFTSWKLMDNGLFPGMIFFSVHKVSVRKF